jgi:hypothetical protein
MAVKLLSPRPGNFNISFRCLLRLLDETMQGDQLALASTKYDACDHTTRQATAHFPKPVAEASAQWHPDGPAPLHTLQIIADCAALIVWKAPQPVSDRFVSRCSPEEL